MPSCAHLANHHNAHLDFDPLPWNEPSSLGLDLVPAILDLYLRPKSRSPRLRYYGWRFRL